MEQTFETSFHMLPNDIRKLVSAQLSSHFVLLITGDVKMQANPQSDVVELRSLILAVRADLIDGGVVAIVAPTIPKGADFIVKNVGLSQLVSRQGYLQRRGSSLFFR